MLRNNVASTLSFFYPFGNTPAICLTQNLPANQSADLLLLGCGDVRNILFTNYARLGIQPLNFTCCDIEPAIIEMVARNVLFLSLIIDDANNENSRLLWNIYYHVRIDHASLSLLDSQAFKLLECSHTLTTWNDGHYGQSLRFCNSATLAKVRSIWSGYTKRDKTPDQIKEHSKVLENALKTATNVRHTFFSEEGIQLSALRSAAPTGTLGIRELPALAQEYWKNGYLKDEHTSSDAHHLNPAILFAGSSNPILHYGSDPLLGFHLATAYTPLSDCKHPPSETSDSRTRVVSAAQAELRAWFTAFRSEVKRKSTTVRWFCGDALAFAHTLQSLNQSYGGSAGWHTNAWTFTPLSLDSNDYRNASMSAPILYHTIDTSNLSDHIGTLNLLVATAPLLHRNPSSTIYTESLVQHETNVRSTLDGILCGDFTTMTLLLGLAVVDTWTNVASSSDHMDQMLFGFGDKIFATKRKYFHSKQMRTHIPWKLSTTICSSKIYFVPKDLAGLLHTTYKSMFGHEDPSKLMASLSLSGVDKISNPFYNRASFAAFLYLLRSHINTD